MEKRVIRKGVVSNQLRVAGGKFGGKAPRQTLADAVRETQRQDLRDNDMLSDGPRPTTLGDSIRQHALDRYHERATSRAQPLYGSAAIEDLREAKRRQAAFRQKLKNSIGLTSIALVTFVVLYFAWQFFAR